MKIALLILFAFLFSYTSNAQDRLAFLCGDSQEVRPNIRTEFYLVIDLATVETVDDQKIVAAFIKASLSSTLPKPGIDALVNLRVTKFEELNENTWFDVNAHEISMGGSKISFQTGGLGAPHGSPRIYLFSAKVDDTEFSGQGTCIRRKDLDSLWAQQDSKLLDRGNGIALKAGNLLACMI